MITTMLVGLWYETVVSTYNIFLKLKKRGVGYHLRNYRCSFFHLLAKKYNTNAMVERNCYFRVIILACLIIKVGLVMVLVYAPSLSYR